MSRCIKCKSEVSEQTGYIKDWQVGTWCPRCWRRRSVIDVINARKKILRAESALAARGKRG